MFWIDGYGVEKRIVRAGMDGSNRVNVITGNIKQPNGLAIDYKDSRLYWSDSGWRWIASSDFNGQSRITVVKGSLQYPFAITIFGDRVYWSDWDSKSIHSSLKKTGNETLVVKKKVERLWDLKVFELKRQREGIFHAVTKLIA